MAKNKNTAQKNSAEPNPFPRLLPHLDSEIVKPINNSVEVYKKVESDNALEAGDHAMKGEIIKTLIVYGFLSLTVIGGITAWRSPDIISALKSA